MPAAGSTRRKPAGDREEAVQASPVVDRLVGLGVSPVIAAQLVRTHGEAAVLAQLEALPFRRVRDKAAALVASVLHRWQLPAACVDARRLAHDQAQKAARRAVEGSLRAAEAQRRLEAQKRLAGLSEAERAALEARVRAALAAELPAAARLMLGKRAGSAWVQARMLAELEGGR